MNKLTAFGLVLLIISSSIKATEITVFHASGLPAAGVVVALSAEQETEQVIAAKKALLSKKLTISQHRKKFTPYLSIVTTDAEVTFNNLDDITHHIYSVNSKDRFDFKLRKEAPGKVLKFEKKQSISMGCNIHDWMAGHLLVLDTPFYGITDDKGYIRFSNLPSGNFNLALHHPQMDLADTQQKHQIKLPLNVRYEIYLTKPIAKAPAQESLDDFDFVENY